MSNSVKTSKEYLVNSRELLQCTVKALSTLDAKINTEGAKDGRIIATFKPPFVTLSTDVPIKLEIEVLNLSPEQSRLCLEAYPIATFGNRAAFGGGNLTKKRAASFFSALDDQVRTIEREREKTLAVDVNDPFVKLKQLKEMADANNITEIEYEDRKSEILKEWENGSSADPTISATLASNHRASDEIICPKCKHSNPSWATTCNNCSADLITEYLSVSASPKASGGGSSLVINLVVFVVGTFILAAMKGILRGDGSIRVGDLAFGVIIIGGGIFVNLISNKQPLKSRPVADADTEREVKSRPAADADTEMTTSAATTNRLPKPVCPHCGSNLKRTAENLVVSGFRNQLDFKITCSACGKTFSKKDY